MQRKGERWQEREVGKTQMVSKGHKTRANYTGAEVWGAQVGTREVTLCQHRKEMRYIDSMVTQT